MRIDYPRRGRTGIRHWLPSWRQLLSIAGLKVRDIVGFTFLQFLLHTPFVLFLLWLFAMTLTYVPPVMPG